MPSLVTLGNDVITGEAVTIDGIIQECNIDFALTKVVIECRN